MTIKAVLDLFLHADVNLARVIAIFGAGSYGILFLVIFIETGLVIMPFLPGDSLLFAAGALAAGLGSFNLKLLYPLMVLAAFTGDTVNYWIGYWIGPRAFDDKVQISKSKKVNSFIRKVLKKEYLEKAQRFYEKHGGKAILLARFVPIVRTFAPFVAGVGQMEYIRFISFNFFGGLAWVTLMLLGGYFFGNIPLIKENFHYTVLVIILISLVPIGVELLKSRRKNRV